MPTKDNTTGSETDKNLRSRAPHFGDYDYTPCSSKDWDVELYRTVTVSDSSGACAARIDFIVVLPTTASDELRDSISAYIENAVSE